jgi:predicted amidohydrolase YtcJ
MRIGVLLDNAQDLLKQPKLTQEDLLRRFKVTVREAHKHGLTSIHDAGLDPISLEFFHRYHFSVYVRLVFLGY